MKPHPFPTPTRSILPGAPPRGPARRRAALAVAVAAFLTAAACSSEESSSGDDADEGSDASGEVVRLITYDAYALPEQAVEAFEEQSGATVEVVATGDSGTMLAKALLSAGAPEGDVIFGIDNTTAAEAASEPLLEQYRPEAASALDVALAPPGVVADSLTPIDTSEVCVNVDASWFADNDLDLPETFDDLADPSYAGLLSVQSPVSSSPGMAFLLGTVETYGEDGWIDYWGRLAANDVRVSPSWDDAYYGDYTVSGGDRPMVVSYASSPPAEVVFSEGERTEPASVVMDDTCVTQVEYAGVLAGAEHPELARELLDFMLSEEWQRGLPLSNFVYPVTDVELPEEFARWAPRPEQPVVVDVDAVATSRDDWVERWREAME
ncbi:MAG: thiamine ABC transporter substrate-binding protein [Actinomycetia bacterium]|nr:thiamine ABC transporter substrate-binding protein [Actinomycetes bacterium]